MHNVKMKLCLVVFTVMESSHFLHLILHGRSIWPVYAVSYLVVKCFLFDSWIVLQVNDTPLHEASREGHTEVCRYLISAGAGIDRLNGVSTNLPIMTSSQSKYAWELNERDQEETGFFFKNSDSASRMVKSERCQLS